MTFTQSGIGVDTGTNQVLSLSVNGGGASAYNAGTLSTPSTWYDSGTVLTYTYSATVDTSPASTKRYRLTGTSPSGLYTVSAGQTITGTYVIQWQVTFKQTGIGGDTGTNTILTLPGPTNYNLSQFDVNQWVDNNAGISYTYTATVAATAGKQYVLTSVVPLSLANVTAATTVIGTYKTQYYLTITTNPTGNVPRGQVTPANGWFDSGQMPSLMAAVSYTPGGGTGYTFKNWTGDVPSSPNASDPVTVTMDKLRTIVANYTTWGLAWDTGLTYTAQYSDPMGLRAVLTADSIPVPGNVISFSVGTDTGSGTTNVPGVAATDNTAVLTQAPGSYTAGATCPIAQCGVLLTITYNPYNITKEDARATYTGPLFASTSSPSSTAFTVLLTATIQDITAVPADPAYDTYPGDIRKAVARFVNRDAADATLCTAPIGLVNAADPKTGTISCNFSGDVGNASSIQYTVGIIVDGYYTRNNSLDISILNVAQAIPGMITGGGYLQMFTPTKSAGQYLGDAGLKTNFGFNVKYKSGGTKPQGNLNFIIRSGGKAYQIKSNATNTLAINPTNCQSTAASPCQATFTSKANLTDITNETAPISLGGNLNMIVTMTDNGEPGSADTFAITLYDSSNNVLFSSNWTGTQTVEQLLGGGNTVVH